MHPNADLPVSMKVAVGRTFRATGIDTVSANNPFLFCLRIMSCNLECFQPKSISLQYGMSIPQFFDMNADLRGMQEDQAFNLDQVMI